jgi:hypothetical protein
MHEHVITPKRLFGYVLCKNPVTVIANYGVMSYLPFGNASRTMAHG